MKILFTGASSFTGYWFVRELTAAGHSVTALFRNELSHYDGIRRQRIDLLLPICQPVFKCSFGNDDFLKLLDAPWDLVCHHGADVTDYKSSQFDIGKALVCNTKNSLQVLSKLAAQKSKLLITGSVFEQNEGGGSDHLPAFSAYGLSKGFTAEVFKHQAAQLGVKLGKFVISNPFGPYEEPRFTSYLVKNWMQKKSAAVNTPDYIRDNIHVDLLAKAYVHFAQNLKEDSVFEHCNPSGYAESQGDFTKRFATAMRERLNLPCEFTLAHQTDFSEPRARISKDRLNLKWDEKHAWDQLAHYYTKAYN